MAKIVTIPANAVKQEIDLELNKPSERQRVHAIQYDNNKAYIVATVWNNGEQYKLTTDDTIAFVCTKPDGHGINKEAFIDNEGRIIFPIGEQLTVVYGEFPAEFRIFSVTYDDEGKIIPVSKATTSFMVWIEKSSLQNDTVISSDDFDTLTKLITEATEVITNANIAIDNAITATSNATNATHEAIVATNNANTATANANTATVNANNAADRANEAANNANIATTNAIAATENANEAADRANRAAQDAEDVIAGTGIVMESQKGQPNGVASLDENGKVPDEQLPEIEVPVTSVNGQIGDVVLTADDVGAETPAGAQAKANTALNSAKQYTDQALNEHLDDNASTSKKGHVQLTDSISSTSTTTAATPNSVKQAYDKANAALPKTGGEMTGILTAQSNTSYTVRQVRNIILSTADADVGAMQNGDIWIKYK